MSIMLLIGTHPRVLRYFHEYLIMSCRLDEENLWGDAYSNHTGTGTIGKLFDRTTDLSVAAFYYWSNMNLFVQFSYSIQLSTIKMLVPRPR